MDTYEAFEAFLDSPIAVKQMHEGKRISSVRLGQIIGVGAFGKVYSGNHSFTGDQVAVKQLRKPYSKETDLCIRNEIEIMTKLSHPHIVLLYQVIETSASTSIVMEFANVGTLRKWISSDALTSSLMDNVFANILSAVEYLHNLSIAHRDIKAENIFMTSWASPLLGDFGFAIDTSVSPRCSQYCGSPLFCAPELLKNHEYFPDKVDLWALGILLVLLTTGNYPLHPDDSEKWSQEELDAISCTAMTSQRKMWLHTLLKIDAGERCLPTLYLSTIDEMEEVVGEEKNSFHSCREAPKRNIYNGRQAVEHIFQRRHASKALEGNISSPLSQQQLFQLQTQRSNTTSFKRSRYLSSSICVVL
eukprot:m.14395 g.14395  ORF g.14395 m.14395 type:complete len:360 (+) comp4301_c0_seq1:163-1242(+)